MKYAQGAPDGCWVMHIINICAQTKPPSPNSYRTKQICNQESKKKTPANRHLGKVTRLMLKTTDT